MKPAVGAMGTSTTAAANRMATAGGGSFWHEILGAFSPNRGISKAALRFIIAFQIAVLLVVWLTSTYVFLPTPMVLSPAFVDSWLHHARCLVLLVSFLLNVSAMP